MSEAMQPPAKQGICLVPADIRMVESPEQQMASPWLDVGCQPDRRYLMSGPPDLVVSVMVTHKSAGSNGYR